MLIKSKWVILVVLVGILLVSGVALGAESDTDSHTIRLDIDEVAWISIEGDDFGGSWKTKSLSFTIFLGQDDPSETTAGQIHVKKTGGSIEGDGRSATDTVDISYTSIVDDAAKKRTITAELDKAWADGVELAAEISDGPNNGDSGYHVKDNSGTAVGGTLIEVDSTDKTTSLPVTDVVLIENIGSVELATATITYTATIKDISVLSKEQSDTITVTLTINEED